jgi:uncharacterized protein YcsI (UPF0317 family)
LVGSTWVVGRFVGSTWVVGRFVGSTWVVGRLVGSTWVVGRVVRITSGWRAVIGAGNNLGDKELKGKKGHEVGEGCGCKGGGVGW